MGVQGELLRLILPDGVVLTGYYPVFPRKSASHEYSLEPLCCVGFSTSEIITGLQVECVNDLIDEWRMHALVFGHPLIAPFRWNYLQQSPARIFRGKLPKHNGLLS